MIAILLWPLSQLAGIYFCFLYHCFSHLYICEWKVRSAEKQQQPVPTIMAHQRSHLFCCSKCCLIFLSRHNKKTTFIFNMQLTTRKPVLTWLHTNARWALCVGGHSSGYTPAPSHYSNLKNTQLHTGSINSHHLNVNMSPDLLSYFEWLLNINHQHAKNDLQSFHSFSHTQKKWIFLNFSLNVQSWNIHRQN